MVLRLHILGAGNQKRHYTYVPWMLWLMLGIPSFVCLSTTMSQPSPVATLVSLIFEAGDLANGIVKCIMDPRSKNQVLVFYSMAEGYGWGFVGPWWYIHQKIPFDPKVRQKSDLMSDFFWKKSQDFNISTAVGHTETWLQLAVFGFGRHLAVPTKCGKTIRRSWSWRKSFGSDSMDRMCLDKAEDATDGPMEFQLWL